MKKTIFIVLILCFVLASCVEQGDEQSSEISVPVDNNISSVISEPENQNDWIDPEAIVMIEDYNEYLEFINGGDFPEDFPHRRTEDNVLPENFVEFGMVDFLGKFISFLCLTKAQDGDYTQCLYSIDTGDPGCYTDQHKELALYVELEGHYSEEPDVPELEIPKSGNLFLLDDESSGKIHISDACYVYNNGRLYGIYWWSNGAYCKLVNFHRVDYYDSKLINDLFDVYSAPGALEFLKSLGN